MAEKRGVDGATTLTNVVHEMAAQQKSTPEMLKAYGLVLKQVRAAKLASELPKADVAARSAAADKVAQDLLGVLTLRTP